MITCVCPNPSIDTFAWMSGVKPGTANRILREEQFPGGKGVHVAMAIAELGHPVNLLGCWAGSAGDWIQDQCRQRGIRCLGPSLKGNSRKCLTIRTPGHMDGTEILGTGPHLYPNQFSEFTQILKQLLVHSKVVTLSGSWPEGAPSHAYATLLRECQRARASAYLDCSGPQLAPALKEEPFGVHLNRHETEHWSRTRNLRKGLQWLSKHCHMAVLTDGERGAYLAFKGESFHGHCPLPNVHSAVGSGDCLLAGFAVAKATGMNAIDSLQLGVACGAANCLHPELGILKRSDVKKLITKTKITAL